MGINDEYRRQAYLKGHKASPPNEEYERSSNSKLGRARRLYEQAREKAKRVGQKVEKLEAGYNKAGDFLMGKRGTPSSRAGPKKELKIDFF